MTAKKLKVTPQKEAVDLSAMKPASGTKSQVAFESGTKLKVDLSAFESVTSKEGNLFHVFGATPMGIRLSLRMWKESSLAGGTRIGFRVRLGDRKESQVTDKEFESLGAITKVFTNSSAKETGHRSIQGGFLVHVPSWNTKAVLEQLETEGCISHMAHALNTSIGPLGMLDVQNLRSLFYQLVIITLSNVPAPSSDAPPLEFAWGPAGAPALLMFGSHVHPTSVLVKVETPPAPYAAPHPKATAKASGAAATSV